jgi:hypothetical protein
MRDPRKSRRAGKSFLAAACLLAAACAPAQTLARPGWMGNSLNADPWWLHGTFYEVGSPSDSGGNTAQVDFKYIAARLDALRSLGVDAVLLPALSVPTQAEAKIEPAAANAAPAPDVSLDDFDELIHQASDRSMHILVTLPATGANSDLTGAARFWLNRGAAGFHVVAPPGTSPQETQAIVLALRKLTSSAIGQRIVLSNLDTATVESASPAPAAHPAAAHHTHSGHAERPADASAAHLQIDSRMSALATLDAASLRPLLAQTLTQPNLLLSFHPPTPPLGSPDPSPELARAMATVLLTLHPANLIDAGAHLTLQPNAVEAAAPAEPGTPPPTPVAPPQPAPPPGTYVPYVPPVRPATPPAAAKPLPADPITDWYRQLSQLHHSNVVMHTGTTTFVDFDQQNALVWVTRVSTNSLLTPPVVVVCNLSSSPAQLSIGAAIKSLGLRGTYMRTLLRSDKAMGAQDLNAVILPPFAVYIGELHYR